MENARPGAKLLVIGPHLEFHRNRQSCPNVQHLADASDHLLGRGEFEEPEEGSNEAESGIKKLAVIQLEAMRTELRLHCVEAALDCQHGIRHVADNRFGHLQRHRLAIVPKPAQRPGCKDRRHRDFADVARSMTNRPAGKSFSRNRTFTTR